MGRRQEPSTIFKRTGSRDKRLACTTQYSVSKTKEIGHKYHATLNDIMLSCIAGAMRKVMTVTGTNPQQIPEDLVLCATIPANMRPLDEELRVPGNKWMSLFLDLPVGMTDPIKRLICVRDASRQVKEPLVKQLLYLLGHLTIACPDDIIRFVIYWFCKRTSVAITNVCGSSQALNMCGRKALSFVGFVPCPAYINLGIALVSIGDQLGLNVAIDQVMNVAPETFLTFVEEEYETLQNLTSETNKKKIKYQ
jgi:hypothetical protein